MEGCDPSVCHLFFYVLPRTVPHGIKLKEALTRAEAEGEEAAARHRTWMRQAQARQTELEATAAQLAEALADANRRLSGGGEVR